MQYFQYKFTIKLYCMYWVLIYMQYLGFRNELWKENGSSDIIISGDKHFLRLNMERLRTMNATQYLEWLETEK